MKILTNEFDGEFWVVTILVGKKKYRAGFDRKPSPSYVESVWKMDLGKSDFREVR